LLDADTSTDNRLRRGSRRCKRIAPDGLMPRSSPGRFAVIPLQYGDPQLGLICRPVAIGMGNRGSAERNQRECPSSRNLFRLRCPRVRLKSLERGRFPRRLLRRPGLQPELGSALTSARRRQRRESMVRSGFRAGWSKWNCLCGCCCSCASGCSFSVCLGGRPCGTLARFSCGFPS
jgi:hypothetical protein